MAHPSKFTALLQAKCPRCRRGNMFSHSALNITKFDKMPEYCPVCHFRFEVEPGFFWGAMYFSYAFSVGIIITVGVLLYYLAHDPSTGVYLAVVTGVILVTTPLLFRYARVLMLYMFGSVKYDPRFDQPEAGSY